ncbi:GGDEF domain-containing protein [Cohnella nanjingensis]|uniref:GGDEF domain-containing protein n=1 Tax=Cohnella nanjingensis TaxID=1387779 RepID=A0A7X0RU81_9BACL|nr:GGDEF domain-containing protein [Cohnella nanjingensis]MBB6672571.1 GGDEF domain-containing protein [Cohnella nanjingensis]
MAHTGGMIGMALASGICTAVVLTLTVSRGFTVPAPFDLWVGAGFATILYPLGWSLGRQYDRMKHRAERDSLTGAFNRGFIGRCYPQLAKRAARAQKRISVALIDVNDFKAINDVHGHMTGDLALLRLADALNSCTRRGEIVGRWGGDEFLVLCPYAERDELDSLERLISDKLDRLSSQEGLKLSISFGTAVYPGDGQTLECLAAAADRHMYENKRRAKAPAQAAQRLNA